MAILELSYNIGGGDKFPPVLVTYDGDAFCFRHKGREKDGIVIDDDLVPIIVAWLRGAADDARRLIYSNDECAALKFPDLSIIGHNGRIITFALTDDNDVHGDGLVIIEIRDELEYVAVHFDAENKEIVPLCAFMESLSDG